MSSIVHEHGRGCWLSWALCWDHSIIYFVLIEMKVRVLGPTAFTLIRFIAINCTTTESGLMKVLVTFLRKFGLRREFGSWRCFTKIYIYIYIWYYCLAMALSRWVVEMRSGLRNHELRRDEFYAWLGIWVASHIASHFIIYASLW